MFPRSSSNYSDLKNAIILAAENHEYKFSAILMILKIRMTTFIKAKLKKSDWQTNIDKYRVAA